MTLSGLNPLIGLKEPYLLLQETRAKQHSRLYDLRQSLPTPSQNPCKPMKQHARGRRASVAVVKLFNIEAFLWVHANIQVSPPKSKPLQKPISDGRKP